MILVHGTTRRRAESILANGPDPCYAEPGGLPVEDGFSMYVETGPFLHDPPETYARRKASAFPDEGGPVILALDVPEPVVQAAADASPWHPLSAGVIQFDRGAGLEELLAEWPAIRASAEIREVP